MKRLISLAMVGTVLLSGVSYRCANGAVAKFCKQGCDMTNCVSMGTMGFYDLSWMCIKVWRTTTPNSDTPTGTAAPLTYTQSMGATACNPNQDFAIAGGCVADGDPQVYGGCALNCDNS